MSECSFNQSDVNDFWSFFYNGEYESGIPRTAIDRSYIELAFLFVSADGASIKHAMMRVFSDDYVVRYETASDTAIEAHLDGAYQKVFDYIASTGSSAGYLCHIVYDNMDGVYTSVEAAGDRVFKIYERLKKGAYRTDLDRTAVEKTHFTLTFRGSKSGTYNIWSDDYVEWVNKTSDEETLEVLGHLDGIYNQAHNMLSAALNVISADEEASGCKLNSLGVTGKSSSRLSVADFADVGCIYIEELLAPGEERYSYIIYFDSCSVAELEEKIAILEAREDVSIVSKVIIRDSDNPAYD